MIDFASAKVRNKAYAGANGSKISVIYNNEQYMLKFPPLPTINKEMSYTNSCISEYIGCKIFDSVGIPVQETVIGTYTSNGREKNSCCLQGLYIPRYYTSGFCISKKSYYRFRKKWL